jgi:hypothetical protein
MGGLPTTGSRIDSHVAPLHALWIAYPKKTPGMKTDLSRDVGWEDVERASLSAVTQVAVDETWSALRFRAR